MLKQNCCLAGPHFRPPAIVEVLQDYVTNFHKVRRLHLIVVDLWRPWKYNTARARDVTDQLWRIQDGENTRRVSPFRPDGPQPPLRCRRFAYGYALDSSEFPCYLVWPQREERSYVLLDTATTDTLLLDEQSSFRPLGMQHFYDSFALASQICIRSDALELFGLRDDELLPDLHITKAGVLRAELGSHQEHLVDQDAQAADRNKVPAEVINVASHEVDSDSGKDESIIATSDSEESGSESDTAQNEPASTLASDSEQYELMQTAYAAGGRDFVDKGEFIGSEYHKLRRLELVPQRWPLARQKSVDHLDRVLAGCCWEAHATRAVPEESLSSIRLASKRLTMLLAGYLAKVVAAILREILTHPTKKLYDDNTAHLLCSNYWLQPIYQELLHSSSRYNTTGTGEKNRPSNGLARISAHPRPPKKLKPPASGTRFTDWIGGVCYADTLQVWFPAHWAPLVLRQLQRKEDERRAANPSWVDQDDVPDDIRQRWQEARANRSMQFKVGDFKSSKMRMLTGTLKADWIQLPVESYLEVLPTLKQGVIAGVFRIKGASPWAITRAEKLQVSVFLPNEQSMDDWYSGVYALPTVWPDVSMMGKVAGYDFRHVRKKYDVPSMWGNVRPRWRLLQQHLEATGPGWYSEAEREERLFTNRSNQPGDDMNDEVRIDDDFYAWSGGLQRPDYGGYVNQPLPWSFLVSMEYSLAFMPTFERKSKSYRCSLLVVSKMYQLAG